MSVLPAFTFGNIFFAFPTFFVLLLAYFLYKYLIRPYFNILYYKRQGATSIFHWQLIPYIRSYQDAFKKGDFYYIYKKTLKDHPNSKFFVENSGSRVHLVLIDSEMAKEALKKHEIYQKEKEFLEIMRDFAGGTTILAEEKAWKKGRRIISSAFNFEFLKHTVPLIIETTQEKFNEWILNHNLVDADLIHHLGAITGEITGRFFFGKRFGEKRVLGQPMTEVIQKLAIELILESFTVSHLLFGPKFVKTNILPRHKELNKMTAAFKAECREMIEETERSEKHEKNLLGLLLELRKNGLEEDRLTDEQIIGEFIGLFGAGTDTISHLVNSALYFLWKNPETLSRVKEEVDREFVDLHSIDLDNLNRMEYTTAVLKETLRMGGSIVNLFTRFAAKDDNLCGIKIKKGTLLNFFHKMYYANEKYYSEHEKFVPERWLPNSPYSNEGWKTEPYAFIPFSAGPRNCVGQHLGMIEARILIAMFIKTFKFSFPVDYKLTFIPRFVYEPLKPFLITLEPRIQ